jgi:hypothetical protein
MVFPVRAFALLVSGALVACGATANPVSTTGAAPPNEQRRGSVSECKLLTDRIDALDQRGDDADAQGKDAAQVVERLRAAAKAMEATATDVEGLRLADEPVRTVAHDYAALLREHTKDLGDVQANFAGVARGVRTLGEQQRALMTSIQAFGEQCKATKSPDCPRFVVVLKKLPPMGPTEPEGGERVGALVSEATAIPIADPAVQRYSSAITDALASVGATMTALKDAMAKGREIGSLTLAHDAAFDQRLVAVCGRPVKGKP